MAKVTGVVPGMFAAWLTVSAACGGPDSGAAGSDGGTEGAAPDASEACASADDCGADRPICTSGGVCVECETSADCPTEFPVCGDHSCQASCAGDEVAADLVALPSDIIWIVDQSGSMTQETANVQTNINSFVSLIGASHVDFRVVMIATKTGSNAICVPEPLGGASCGNNTQFRLVNQRVASHNGPALLLSTYAMYSDFLRPNAVKHLVFVTDDNSDMTAANFTSGIAGLQPAGVFANMRIHGIYAFGNGQATGCTGAFGTGAADGTVYTTLIQQTGGAAGVICTGDWSQVFNDITAAVVAGSQVSCELAMPTPPRNQSLDPAKVNVKYQIGGVAPGETLPQVQSANECSVAGGWYYDDNVAPTSVTMCPATCSAIQGDPMANVSIEFGCATQLF